MIPSRRSVSVFALVAVAGSACHKAKPAPPPAPAVAPPSAPVAPPRPNQDSIDAARRASEEAARRAAADAEARRNAAAIEAARNTLTQAIYFDFDKDEIRDDQRSALDQKVPILTANAGVRIRIEGNTDSRGSDTYNLALGQRRAAAAKRYLVSRGIADSRIDVVSFGEDRPVAQGDSEDAWAKNRRDEFVITVGADNIRVSR
jgi:peptidoglycan-associated lipoprotein